MTEILSLWRSPLDQVGLIEAQKLAARQPQCSIGYNEDFSAMTIFNYGHYVSGIVTPTGALINMFTAMAPNTYSAYGGRAFIPQKSYAVTASSIAVPDQSVIDGSGGGGGHSGNYWDALLSFCHYTCGSRRFDVFRLQ